MLKLKVFGTVSLFWVKHNKENNVENIVYRTERFVVNIVILKLQDIVMRE